MDELFLLIGFTFVLCCFLGKPMKLAVRGILGLIGGLILAGLILRGIMIVVNIIAGITLIVIVIQDYRARSRRR